MKKVVINLGDVRDNSWETQAALGLGLIARMREAGFKPSTESPYVSDSMDEDWYSLGLGEDGDVPLLIVVELDDNDKLKSNIELLESMVGEKASVDVLGEDDDDDDEVDV